MRERLQNVSENVRLIPDSLQVWIFFAVVISNRIGFEKLRILDQQFDRLSASLRSFQGRVQNRWRPLPAIDGD